MESASPLRLAGQSLHDLSERTTQSQTLMRALLPPSMFERMVQEEERVRCVQERENSEHAADMRLPEEVDEGGSVIIQTAQTLQAAVRGLQLLI